MRRLWFVIAIAACSDPSRSPVDAKLHDAPADSAGSGSHFTGGFEPSPRDYNLELGVLAVSLVVVAGPVRARRRRDA